MGGGASKTADGALAKPADGALAALKADPLKAALKAQLEELKAERDQLKAEAASLRESAAKAQAAVGAASSTAAAVAAAASMSFATVPSPEKSINKMDELLDKVAGVASSWQANMPDQTDVGDAFWAFALGDFEAEAEGELSIFANEVAVVLGESIEGGWLQAMKGNEVGLVPETYVARLQLRPHFVLERHEQASEAEADWSTPDAPPPAAAFAVDAGDIVGVIDRMELLMIAPIPDEGAGEQLYCIKAPGHSMPIGPGFVPAAKLRPAQALVAVDTFEAEYGLEISLARGQMKASLIAHRHQVSVSGRSQPRPESLPDCPHHQVSVSGCSQPRPDGLPESLPDCPRHQVSASGCSQPRMMAATARMIGVR